MSNDRCPECTLEQGAHLYTCSRAPFSAMSPIDAQGLGVAFVAPVRFENSTPVFYRLARKQDGELVLQGAYQWTEGFTSGHEWRDIPTEQLK